MLEFGLVAPLLIIFIYGTVEVVNILRVQLKLNAAAGQLVEMIASQTAVTTGSANGSGGTLGDFCTAASYNMRPFPTNVLSAWIESTTVNQSLGTGQDWASDQACPASIQAGSFTETIALTSIADTPRSLFTADGTPRSSGGTGVKGYTAISLQLTYVYANILPFVAGSSITLRASAAARPRANTAVLCTYTSGSSTASCPGVY